MAIQLPKAMTPVTSNREQNGRIRAYAQIIEEYFEAHGIPARVTEVNSEPHGIQFCIEVAVGTEIERILKLQKELTRILAAPHNRLAIEAPIPGRNLIGITIPRVCSYPDIPVLESPDPNSENIWLLKKSAQYYRHYQKVCGPTLEKEKLIEKDTHDVDSITRDYFFLKTVFSKFEKKPDLRVNARILEATFEAFGLSVNITEININADHYLYFAKPKNEMEAKNIVKLNKDIALALSAPGGTVGIRAPMPERDEIGISVFRINILGEPITVHNFQDKSSSRGYFRKIISTKLLKISRDFFLRYELKFRKADLYSLVEKYRKQFRKMYNNQLITVFNEERGASDSLRERASRLFAMQQEFDRRNIDYSNIAMFTNGLSYKEKISLVGKKIVI